MNIFALKNFCKAKKYCTFIYWKNNYKILYTSFCDQRSVSCHQNSHYFDETSDAKRN